MLLTQAVMNELDAYRCAAWLIKHHDGQALVQAIAGQGEFLLPGDQAVAADY